MSSYIDPRDRHSFDPINPSAAMSNRAPQIPACQQADVEPRRYAEPGYRRFDATLGCWIAKPAPAPVFGSQPRRTPQLPKGSGRYVYDVFDRKTGERMGSTRADVITHAARAACDWAVRCGFSARDVYVK